MKGPETSIFYTGAGTTYGTFNNAAAADGDSVHPPFTTDLTDTGHGLKAGSCLYIQGTTNYDGLRKIASLPDANSMLIYAKFVAETLAGTETWKVMYSSPHKFELMGVNVHLSAASGTSENLVISKDANEGSEYDVVLNSKDMNGLADYVKTFDPPIPCLGGDKINVAWANSDSRTWGIEIVVRRVG